MGKKMSTFALQLFLWCVLVMPPLSEASGSQCWRPNHTLLAEYDHPCEPSHDESFCCGVGWTCAYDKICYPTSALGSNWLSFTPTRGSCTDISWTSSECPNFCVSSLDHLDNGQSFYQCPDSSPPRYCCHQQDCNCADGGNFFTLPAVAQISLIMDPSKSSIVLPPVTQVLTVISSQTIINNLISVVETNAPTQLVSVTYTPIPSTTSQQSTSSSQAQLTSSQSPEVDQNTQTFQGTQAGVAPARSGARKFRVDCFMPVVALAIGALVLLVLRH